MRVIGTQRNLNLSIEFGCGVANNEVGFHRCKNDSNLYCHKSTELYVLCYVDDLLVCGTPERTREFTDRLSQEVLLKVEEN